MTERDELISIQKAALREYKATIRTTRQAIRALKKQDLASIDRLTIKAYRRAIKWNKEQIRDCREQIRNIKLRYPKNYWTIILLIIITLIFAVIFPISVFTFAPLLIPAIIGIFYFLIKTSKPQR